MKDFVEQRIIKAVRGILTGRVNEILHEEEFDAPVIEFTNYGSGYGLSPSVALSTCEKNEKERIIQLDAYSVAIAFELPEEIESERQCYAYCAAVCKALKENPALGGVADRAVVTGEKYVPPKKANCGCNWEVIISLRITVEAMC